MSSNYENSYTFLILASMSDKDKAAEYLFKYQGLLKQFTAFTAGLSSILAGAYAQQSKKEDFTKHWKVISEYMPQLFPLTEVEKNILLETRSTASFKKAITTRF